MASVIGNPIFIAPDDELIVTVWFPGVDPNGLHVVGPTMPAIKARLQYGHTGFQRWYDIDPRVSASPITSSTSRTPDRTGPSFGSWSAA